MAKKEAYYFSHDANAQDDHKCMVLIDQLGMEGYGIFWALIEKLRSEKEYKLPLNVCSSFAKRWGTSKEKIEAVVKNYSLFTIDEFEYFFSLRLKSSMELKSNKARESANYRWDNANALQPHTTALRIDAIKVKESKEKKIDIGLTTLLDCEKLFLEKTAFNWTEQYAKKEAEKFYNFYSAKGWVIGKNKMKSLTHAIGGWISRQDKPETVNAQPKKMTQQELNEQKAREFMSRL